MAGFSLYTTLKKRPSYLVDNSSDCNSSVILRITLILAEKKSPKTTGIFLREGRSICWTQIYSLCTSIWIAANCPISAEMVFSETAQLLS